MLCAHTLHALAYTLVLDNGKSYIIIIAVCVCVFFPFGKNMKLENYPITIKLMDVCIERTL